MEGRLLLLQAGATHFLNNWEIGFILLLIFFYQAHNVLCELLWTQISCEWPWCSAADSPANLYDFFVGWFFFFMPFSSFSLCFLLVTAQWCLSHRVSTEGSGLLKTIKSFQLSTCCRCLLDQVFSGHCLINFSDICDGEKCWQKFACFANKMVSVTSSSSV